MTTKSINLLMQVMILTLLIVIVFPVWAIESIAERRNTPEPSRPDFLPTKPVEAFQLPPVVVPLAQTKPAETATGKVLRHVVFHGNSVITSEALEGVLHAWLHKSIGAADLESLRFEITRHYVSLGYVNSGALLRPPGLTSNGTATFDIVEGHIAAIRIAGLDGLDDDYLKQKLLPDPAAPLNVDALRERFQLILDDPLFNRMNARIIPGLNLGDAILDIDTERAKPYHLALQFNNYRPPSIGEKAIVLTGWLRNLTGRGDAIEGTVRGATEGDASLGGSVAWRMPLNYSGTGLSVMADHGQSSVTEEPLSAVGVTSILNSWEFGLNQLVFESLRHRFALGISHVDRQNKTWLGGQPFSFVAGEPNGITRVTTTRLWQEYTYRSEQQVLALRSSFSQSANNLVQIAGLPPSPQADTSYGTWLGQAQYVNKLTDSGTQLVVRAVTQATTHRLLSMDGMSIGGVSTVRGFRENQLIVDHGRVVNLELDIPIDLDSSGKFKLNLVPFIDYGKGSNKGSPSTTLSSAGLALRSRWGALTFDLALAGRLAKHSGVHLGNGALQDSGVHFQVSYTLLPSR